MWQVVRQFDTILLALFRMKMAFNRVDIQRIVVVGKLVILSLHVAVRVHRHELFDNFIFKLDISISANRDRLNSFIFEDFAGWLSVVSRF